MENWTLNNIHVYMYNVHVDQRDDLQTVIVCKMLQNTSFETTIITVNTV